MKLEEIILSEAQRQLKKIPGKNEIVTRYRCASGKRKGKLVISPGNCGLRIDPKRKRIGKKSARIKKGIRVMKTKISKRKSVSQMVKRINNRLSGK